MGRITGTGSHSDDSFCGTIRCTRTKQTTYLPFDIHDIEEEIPCAWTGAKSYQFDFIWKWDTQIGKLGAYLIHYNPFLKISFRSTNVCSL